MPITRIPDRYRPGLARIRSMSNENFNELVTALDKCPIVARFALLSSRVTSQVNALNRREIDEILQALFSLAPSRSDSDTPVEKIVSELVDAMRASGKDDLRLTPDGEAEFKNRITTLLSKSSVNISAKASSVRLSYPYVFCDAKILSDIRPIFDRPGDKPIGSVINHTLEIEYHEDGEHKEFYVALDMEDLVKLKKTIDRAEVKAASLKSMLKGTDVPDFDIS